MSERFQLKDFEIVKEIGKGGFGVVYEAKHARLKNVALKKIYCGAGGVPLHRIQSEYQLLSTVTHHNIVKFYGQFKEQDNYYLVLELCPLGSIRSYVKQHGPLSDEAAAYVLKQLICAVQYIHQRKIMHRDLSAGNILISKISSQKYPTIKICDFGLARSLRNGGPPRTVVGTPGFMAPELLGGASYDEAADVYSIGAALYTILTGRDPPVKGKPNLSDLSDLAADLIEGMMTDESHRFTLSEVYNSEYVRMYQPNPREMNSSRRSIEYSERKSASRERPRTSYRRSDSEDRRGLSREREFGYRHASEERRFVREPERQTAGLDRDRIIRQRSQSTTRATFSRASRDRESGFQSASDICASDYRSGARSDIRPTGRLPPTSTLSSIWPLSADRLNGKGFVNNYGRLLVIDSGDIIFEQKGPDNNVLSVMEISSHLRQKVLIFKPSYEVRRFPILDDPRVGIDEYSKRGPYLTLQSLPPEDLKLYHVVHRTLQNMKAQIDKVLLKRPSQFPEFVAKLMESGDFRLVQIVAQGSGDKYVRRVDNGDVVYRHYFSGPGSPRVPDQSVIQKMNEVYEFMLDMEKLVERGGQRFPWTCGQLAVSSPSSTYPSSTSISQSQRMPLSTQLSVASAPPLSRRPPLAETNNYRHNGPHSASERFTVKNIGQGLISVIDNYEKQSIRNSTGTKNQLVFLPDIREPKKCIRFDMNSTSIPPASRLLVDKLREVLHRR